MKIPILFIVFTRLDTTKEVFEQIRNYRPTRLYIASDGSRDGRPDETEKVKEIRDFLISAVDWDCEVKTLFQEENLGCKYGPHNAITWFFENEERGIILEDDCLPSDSYFDYTEEMLDRYCDDLRVFGVAGVNFNSHVPIDHSYYFSSYFFTWGWATWRSRWERHLEIMDSFEQYIENPNVKNLIPNKYVMSKLIDKAVKSNKDEIDAWDYPWFLSCMINNGLITVPAKNLIKNIGFGDGATHTTGNSHNERDNEEISFPLNHPTFYKANVKMDNLFYKNVLKWMSPSKKIMSLSYLKFIFTAYKNGLLRRIGLK